MSKALLPGRSLTANDTYWLELDGISPNNEGWWDAVYGPSQAWGRYPGVVFNTADNAGGSEGFALYGSVPGGSAPAPEVSTSASMLLATIGLGGFVLASGLRRRRSA